MRPLNNSAVGSYRAKQSDLGTPEYVDRVAIPIMSAVDAMPREYRELVNEFGYIEVYNAWRARHTPSAIRRMFSK